MTTPRIGTSGWSYPNWKNRFYPPGLPQSGWFSYYAERFSVVEINNSFYQVPKPETVAAWREAAPEGFLYAVKANRYITHMKKLKAPEDACLRFLGVMRELRETLGPILFQLPPRWRYDGERLRDFLAVLPDGLRYVFEFRDPSWVNDHCLGLLAAKGAALCASHLDGIGQSGVAGAGFSYFRLHGPDGPYQGRYGQTGLAPWAEAIALERDAGREVFCFFDNDQEAFAAEDAADLAAMLGLSRPASPTSQASLASPASRNPDPGRS